MKYKTFTEEEILKFWTLCGWRIEREELKEETSELKPKLAIHHPDCKCEGFGPLCTCLVICNKINDLNTVYYAISEYYLKKRKTSTIKLNFKTSPNFHHAAVQAILAENS